MSKVAALFVDPNGVYANLPDVEVWDEARDARLYDGPWPVVAHPPCGRWCRLAPFVQAVYGHKIGEDGGCFEAALRAVRTFGGVIEHPAYSLAWREFGLPRPIHGAGWSASLFDEGWTCYVEQGRYADMPVRKETWLYACGVELPDLRWGYSIDAEGWGGGQDEWGGMHGWRDKMSKRGASATPPEFRDVLLSMARCAVGRSPTHTLSLEERR